MKATETQLRKAISRWIIFFIVALILSGITAFPMESLLSFAIDKIYILPPFLQKWLITIYQGVKITNHNYPYRLTEQTGLPLRIL